MDEVSSGSCPQISGRSLARTYVGADLEDNWDALFRTVALFRGVATAVGDALGYPYARHVDGAMTAHLRELQALSRQRRASP